MLVCRGMHEHFAILFEIFIIYTAALIAAEIAQRLKTPAVVGEIAVGCLIGPGLLAWAGLNEPLEILAQIGAVLLLFSVGLETRIEELTKIGKTAVSVGVLGVIVPFVMGGVWAHYSGYPTSKALFIAAAFVATSAGITARVLQELKVLDRIESRVILGAAVIDDILAMLLLGVVTSISAGDGIHLWSLAMVVLQAIGFILLIGFFGSRLIERRSHLLDLPVNPLSALTIALAACLGLSVLAEKVGLAAIIGAFLAGMVLAESKQRRELEEQSKPLLAFLVPFFFVVTGMKVDLVELANPSTIAVVLVVTVLAVVSKFAGCGLGAWGLGRRSAAIVGVGMVPRGEVGIIIASLGYQAQIFSAHMYAVIIAVSLLTSVIAPPLLTRLFSHAPAH